MAVATKRDFSISYGLQTDNTGTSTGNTLFVDQVNDRVGVGLNNPSEKFEVSGNIKLSDDNVLKFGANDDLQIYHDGSSNRTIIDDSSGGFKIQSDGNISFTKGTTENLAAFEVDGAVKLYYDNNIRFETTTDGADISGTGSLKVPVGTTAERSDSPVAGDIRFNSELVTYEGYNGNEWGGLGGAAEKDTTVATTAATTCEEFEITTHRSATITTQITQGTDYQIGRYLVIHDGTTASIIEQAAVATGDMLGSFSVTISGGNLLFQVNMNNSSSATVTSLMTKISV